MEVIKVTCFFFFFCKMEKEIQHLQSEIYMKMSHRQALHQSLFTCWLSEKTTFIQPSVPALGKCLSSPLWNHVHVKSFKDMEGTLHPWWPSGKESACQCRRRRLDPWVWKIPWRRTWQPTPVFFLENPMDRGVWRATVHGVAKSRTRWSD